MSKELEVIKPQAASDEDVVKAYHSAEGAMAELAQSPIFKSATRRMIISGLLLNEKKAEIGHGNWIPWCQQHKIEDRTARRHIETAKASCDTLQIGHGVRFEDLSLPRVLELPIANLPKAAFEVRESFDKLIEEKTSKDIVVEWKETEGQKSARENHDIKFTCPHCGHKNKGKFGRTIACANGDCKKKIKVQPDGPTAEQKVAEQIKSEVEVATELLNQLEQWRLREHRALVLDFAPKEKGEVSGRDLLQQIEDSRIALGKELQKLLKKTGKGARGKGGKQ
jgi:hypothetical protein